MSLTRKASSAAKKPIKSPRQDLAAALAERDAELAEARSRQAATAEILRVISQSPADPQPVFESIVAAAARLLGCAMAAVLLRDGDAYVHTAGATPEGRMPGFAPIRVPIDASANFPSRAFLTKTMVHLPDWSLIDLPEHERHVRDAFGVNSALFLPLLRGDACIAVLVFIGKQANTFGSGEIAQAEILPRPGADRDRERAAVPRSTGGFGAAEGLGRSARRDQQIRRRCVAGVRNDPRRVPASLRQRGTRHLHHRRRPDGASGGLARPEG